jgi:nitroreductase
MNASLNTNQKRIDDDKLDGHVDRQAQAATLEQLLSERHSCRGFRSEQVPRDVMKKFLSLAQKTASWCNSQPWHVTITSGAATERFREALLAHVAQGGKPSADIPFPREYRNAYLERRRECGFQLYDSVGIKRGDREASGLQSLENFRLFGAPHVAIITTEEPLGTYGAVDCGAYVANFMLAAQCFGVSSIAQAALASQSKFVRAHFGIPDDRLMVCGISFGYEDASHPANGFRTRRAALEDTINWVEE